MSKTIHVAITGLSLKGFWHGPRFWFHALRSMAQARRAPGNLLAEARTINGVHHTLTTWESKQAMRAFVYSAQHAQAIKIYPKVAAGKTYCYDAPAAPSWRDVPALWEEHGVA